jgi:hypothetical protein
MSPDRSHGPLPVLLVCLTVVTGLVANSSAWINAAVKMRRRCRSRSVMPAQEIPVRLDVLRTASRWIDGSTALSSGLLRVRPGGQAYGGNPVAPAAHCPNASGPLPLCVA